LSKCSSAAKDQLPTHCFRIMLVNMTLRETINQWRSLPPEEKVRRRWVRIPLKVAMSMKFEGEPVELKRLEEAHDRRPLPPGLSTPLSADSSTRH
jgi:hypothetical protein